MGIGYFSIDVTVMTGWRKNISNIFTSMSGSPFLRNTLYISALKAVSFMASPFKKEGSSSLWFLDSSLS